MRHPDHDQLTDTVRGWYSNSAPKMGYIKEQGRFGIYGRNTKASDDRGNEVLVRDLRREHILLFLMGVRAYFAGGPARIYFDDRATDAELRPALLMAGCTWAGAQSYLAHVGAVPVAPAVAGLAVETVAERTLADFAITKLKGFANSEQEPVPAAIQAEMAVRRAELADVGRMWLARVEGEPVATLAWYEDADRLIYNLATRVAFRRRGIARWLLCEYLAQSYARGCRSVIINADVDDMPIQLYRRLGFTDEVYWRSHYVLRGLASAARG